MHIRDVFNLHEVSFSFEFFPPKTDKSSTALYDSMKELIPLKPAYVSVTYGAGGSTRERTHDLVVNIHNDSDLTVVSHLTCVNHTQDEIFKILKRYDENGIHNIFALRGDPPKGQKEFTTVQNGFNRAADLVAFIRRKFSHMGIGVAGFPEGHPECPNRLTEIDYLKEKVDQGAHYICTQLFFNNDDFFDFCERCAMSGINVPIIAGIMPITSMQGMRRMADLALGARFPAKLLRALSRAHDDDYVQKVGIHWASEQVSDLIDNGVKGVHFYTLNKSKATQEVYSSLGLKTSDTLNKNENKKFVM